VGIEASRNEPQSLARTEVDLYFNHYPKGDVRAPMTVDEQLAAVKALKLEDVIAFHRNYYGANHGELAIVGDFDKAAISKTIEESFAGWDSKVAYAPVKSTNEDKAPLHKSINAPDKENGFYTARLNLDLNIDDPDYPLLDLANFIFGDGGLKSRLMDRIRQKDGLSYGGGTGLQPGEIDRAGSFGIDAIAAPQNLQKLEAAIRQELERAVKDGFTAAELAGAKSGLLQQRVQNRSKDAQPVPGPHLQLEQGLRGQAEGGDAGASQRCLPQGRRSGQAERGGGGRRSQGQGWRRDGAGEEAVKAVEVS
jgi:zinc protease